MLIDKLNKIIEEQQAEITKLRRKLKNSKKHKKALSPTYNAMLEAKDVIRQIGAHTEPGESYLDNARAARRDTIHSMLKAENGKAIRTCLAT